MSTQAELETERDQSVQNSHLIERFQTREVEMSEEMDNHRAFTTDLENQLEKALSGLKDAESRHQDLRNDFDTASNEILRLERTVADNSKMKELANEYEHRLSVTASERDKYGRELQAIGGRFTETLTQLREFEEKSKKFDNLSLRCQEVERELGEVVLQFKQSKSSRDEELEVVRSQLSQSIHDAESARNEAESYKKRALDAEAYKDNYKRLKQDYDGELVQHDAMRQSNVEKDDIIKLLQSQLHQSENKNERIIKEFESIRGLQSEFESTVRQSHQENEVGLSVECGVHANRDKQQLRRALQLSQKKQNDYEDACLDLEKERDGLMKERDTMKQSIEVLTYDIKLVEDRRNQESKSRKVEINNLKDVISSLETKLGMMKDDLLASQQEVDLLSRTRSDKTVIEHVHVLEEAKRVTDRQLKESRMEITKLTNHMKSAEKIKSRLTPEQLTELEIRLRTPTDKRLLELEQIIKMKERDCENVYKKLEEARNVIEVEKRRYQRDLKMQEEDNRRLEDDIEVLRARSRTMSSGLDRESALRASNRSVHGNHSHSHSQSISSMPPPPTPPIAYTAYSSKPTPELGKRYSFESARASFNKM